MSRQWLSQPSGLLNMLRAAAGALPFVPRGDALPDRTVTVDGLRDRPRQRRRVRRGHRSALRRRGAADLSVRADLPDGDVTGHRLRLPLRRNGFGAHREPDHPVPADRGHRHRRHRGARREPARAPQGPAGRRGHRRQRRQRPGVAPGHDVPASAAHQPVRRAQAGAAEAAEAAAAERGPAHHAGPDPSLCRRSAGTTTRSTPTRSAPSCSASRPSSRTECSVPQRYLANIEGRLPDAVQYSVRFGKPVVLPATAGLYVDRPPTAGSWRCATVRRATRT